MAWEINTSAEGWDAIKAELETWSKKDLIFALAEDVYEKYVELGCSQEEINVRVRLFKSEMKRLASHEVLVDAAIEKIQEHNTCDNGGNGFWIDRQGYHKVYTKEPSQSV